MNITSIQQSFAFPPEFLEEVEKSNQSHRQDAPLALILQANDPNNTFSSPSLLYDISEIAKVYRVAIEVIGTSVLWRETIRDYAPKSPELILVSAHGVNQGESKGKSIRLAHSAFLEISDLQKEDFVSLPPETVFILSSCCAGKKFAPELAQISGHKVLASRENTFFDLSIFDPSSKPPQLLSYDERGELTTHIFFANGQSESPFMSSETKKELFAKKIEHLKSVAKNGNMQAQHAIGALYNVGITGEQPPEEVAHWFRLAAEQGSRRGQYSFGLYCELGRGVPQSDKEAFHWYLKAANQGLANAQMKVGLFYEKGRGGLEKSEKNAFGWYLSSAQQRNAQSQNIVGICYLKGRGVEQSETEALCWFKRAAAQGYSCAHTNVGLCYEEGLGGLEKSDEKALENYTLAAKQGNSWAKFMMGVFYEKGRGGLAPSKEEAAHWYNQVGTPEEIEKIRQEIESLRTMLREKKLPEISTSHPTSHMRKDEADSPLPKKKPRIGITE